MKIHKEGTAIISLSALALGALVALCFWLFPALVGWLFGAAALIFWLLIVRFFRSPRRVPHTEAGMVFAPADGTVVAIEEVSENEYFGGERRMQVSVFMSIWNVHINWFPVGGTVAYFKYHPGKFLVAWHPKSSEDNERTTTVVDTGKEKILFRQIAGMVARRIVSYARVGETVPQNTQVGFIKFGSRVDVFLPPDAEVLVKLGDKTVGTRTPIARLP